MKYLSPLLFGMAVIIFTLSPTFATVADELLLGIHPYKSAKILHKSFAPLAEVISRATGKPVRIVIAKDYQQHIQQVGKSKLDIAYMGPVSYVQLVARYGPMPMLARLEINGSPTFQGHIFARATDTIRTLNDIKGKQFAFGNPASTMSHLVPRHMLWKAGVGAENLAGFDFLGNHTNVALAVLSGKYDAGAVKEEVFHKNKSRGLRSIAVTPKLSEHLFVANTNLPKQQFDIIRKAMLSLHQQKNGMVTLRGIKKTMTALVPVKDNDYDNLRQILKELASIGVK
ncbi:MAG: phosphate/phosphite/phosphonate ABC transporter substrate-binding protein [Ectothiorhodospiraceae bacterium]|nr:phosphate/phosphite/phosphonate ABC transporter substrate-binding protein [Ectothiorhodospiraceae bacterium]